MSETLRCDECGRALPPRDPAEDRRNARCQPNRVYPEGRCGRCLDRELDEFLRSHDRKDG